MPRDGACVVAPAAVPQRWQKCAPAVSGAAQVAQVAPARVVPQPAQNRPVAVVPQEGQMEGGGVVTRER